MKKVINRKRRYDYPKEPSNLSDVVIPLDLKKTISGFKFLQYESNLDYNSDDDLKSQPKHGNILIFSTINNLKHLGKAKYIIIDGTFKTAPSLYYHNFTQFMHLWVEIIQNFCHWSML